MVVEDGLRDVDVLLLAEVVGGLVLGVVLLHAGKALGGSHAGLLLVLETLSLLKLALVLIALLVSWLALVFPGNKGKSKKSDRTRLANKSLNNEDSSTTVPVCAQMCTIKKVDLLANNGHSVVGCRDTHASDLDSGSAVDLVLD